MKAKIHFRNGHWFYTDKRNIIGKGNTVKEAFRNYLNNRAWYDIGYGECLINNRPMSAMAKAQQDAMNAGYPQSLFSCGYPRILW